MASGNELRLGKFGNSGSINTGAMQGGVRESDVDAKFKNIFQKLDADGNHVLTDNEIEMAKQQVQAAASHGRDSIFSNNEADKMLEAQGIQNTDSETFFAFLKEIAAKRTNENGEVISSETDQNGNAVITTQQGNKTIQTTYDKNSQKPSTQVVVEGDTEETYTYVEGKPVLTKKIENKGKANEKVTTITVDSNGNTVKTSVLEKTSKGTTETITEGDKKTVIETDENGTRETVTEGDKESVTIKDKSGKTTKTIVTENSTDATKYKKTTTTFNANGKTEEIEDATGKTVIEYIGNNKKITTKNGVRTEETMTDNGSTEIVTKEGSDARTVNTKNKDGERLQSTKTTNGHEYTLNYDGAGNITDVVVQFGENIDSICKKFGCTKEELLEANKDTVKKTKSGRTYFNVGDTIKIPDKKYKLEADAKVFQGRKSAEEARAQYAAWQARVAAQRRSEDAEAEARAKTEPITFIENKYNTFEEMAIAHFKQDGVEKPTKRQIQLRVEQYKKLNPKLTDGHIKGNRVIVQYNDSTTQGILQRQIQRERTRQAQANKAEMNAGRSMAADMHEAIHEHMGGVSEEGFERALAKVNKNNVVGLLKQYNEKSPDESLVEAIFDETGNKLSTRKAAVDKIIKALFERAESANVGDRGRQAIIACKMELQSYWSMGIGYCQTAKLDSLINNLIGAIDAAEAMTKTEKDLNKGNGISETLSLMSDIHTKSTAELEAQLKKDGLCADLYEGLKWAFTNSENLDEKVKAKLNKFLSNMGELALAEKSGGEQGFKTKFKELFGVDYNPNLIKGYLKMQQNFAMAQATTMARDGFKNEFAGVIEWDSGDYDVIHRQYSRYLVDAGQGQIKNGNTATDNAIRIQLQKEGIDFATATRDQKKAALKTIIRNTYQRMESEAAKYNNGESFAQRQKSIRNAGAAVFGNQLDVTAAVNEYVASQQQGGAAVNMALKAGAAITIAVATGGTGIPALLGTAALTATASATIDIADRVSSAEGLQDGEIFTILKNATVDGASVFAGGMIGKYAMMFKNANSFVQAGGRLTAQAAGDVATGAAAEYVQTGTITLEGCMFNAVFSAAGNLVSLKALGKVDTPPATGNTIDPTPVVTRASSRGTAHTADVHVGTPKAQAITAEVEQALANPNITASQLADLRKKVSSISNRDVQRNLSRQIDSRASQLSPTETTAYHQTRQQQLQEEVNHIFDRNNALTSTDVRVAKEYIETIDDIATLERLQGQFNTKQTTRGGVSSDYRQITDAINARKAQLSRPAHKTPAQQKAEITEKLNEKISTNKGLDETEVRQVRDYIETITTEADLDEIANTISRLKMTNNDRVALIRLISSKQTEIRTQAAITRAAEVNTPHPTTQDAGLRATGGTPEHPVISPEIEQTFSTNTQNLLREQLPVGGTVIAHKDNFSYLIKNNNGNIEITRRIDQNEFCRVAGNNGNELPLNYVENSVSVRQSLDTAIESGSFTSSVDSYKQSLSTAHKLAYGGATGENLYYMKDGKLLKMEAGQQHQYSSLGNNYVEKAGDVEQIARQYGDPYSTSGVSSPRLAGISEDALPQNIGTQHKYPGAEHLDQYFTQMHRTAKEAMELIESGAPKEQILRKLAEHYQYAANARPYQQINNSLFMNELNTMLTKAGMPTMPHGILDHAAQRLQPESFQRYFIDQYNATALNLDPHVTAEHTVSTHVTNPEPSISIGNGNHTILLTPDMTPVTPAETPRARVVDINQQNLSSNEPLGMAAVRSQAAVLEGMDFSQFRNPASAHVTPPAAHHVNNGVVETPHSHANGEIEVSGQHTNALSVYESNAAQFKVNINDYLDTFKRMVDALPANETEKTLIKSAIDAFKDGKTVKELLKDIRSGKLSNADAMTRMKTLLNVTDLATGDGAKVLHTILDEVGVHSETLDTFFNNLDGIHDYISLANNATNGNMVGALNDIESIHGRTNIDSDIEILEVRSGEPFAEISDADGSFFIDNDADPHFIEVDGNGTYAEVIDADRNPYYNDNSDVIDIDKERPVFEEEDVSLPEDDSFYNPPEDDPIDDFGVEDWG